MNEMCLCTNRNARTNNNQLITYYECVSYLQRIHTICSRIYLQYYVAYEKYGTLSIYIFFINPGQNVNRYHLKLPFMDLEFGFWYIQFFVVCNF